VEESREAREDAAGDKGGRRRGVEGSRGEAIVDILGASFIVWLAFREMDLELGSGGWELKATTNAFATWAEFERWGWCLRPICSFR